MARITLTPIPTARGNSTEPWLVGDLAEAEVQLRATVSESQGVRGNLTLVLSSQRLPAWLAAVPPPKVPVTGDGSAVFTFRGTPPGFGAYNLSLSIVLVSDSARDRQPIAATNLSQSIIVSATASQPTGTGAGVRLTWFQAEAEALNGVFIRRSGVFSRYYVCDSGLWFVQFVSAATKALGLRRTVTDADFSQADFRATDWTYEGIDGQSALAGQASATVPATLLFP